MLLMHMPATQILKSHDSSSQLLNNPHNIFPMHHVHLFYFHFLCSHGKHFLLGLKFVCGLVGPVPNLFLEILGSPVWQFQVHPRWRPNRLYSVTFHLWVLVHVSSKASCQRQVWFGLSK